MTLFDDSEQGIGLEKSLKKKVLAGTMAFVSNSRVNSNEMVLHTFQTLEYLKRAYNKGEEDEYKDYVENGRFNESVQNLIYNSPPLINPYLIDVPLEDLPDIILSHYSDFMNITDKGDYYSFDAKDISSLHFINSDEYHFYNNDEGKKYRLGEEYELSSNSFPTRAIHEVLDGVRMLLGKNSINYRQSDIMSTEITVPKKDFNYEAFMYLYYFFYFDLYMNTFYKEYMKKISMFRNIEFVPKDLEGALSFEELKGIDIDSCTLQEYAGTLYYEYRAIRESSSARISRNCKLGNTPLEEVGFVFKPTTEKLINLEDLRVQIMRELYDKNVLFRSNSDIRDLEDKLNDLSKESYDRYSERIHELIGIEDPILFEYHTQRMTNRLRELASEFLIKERRDKELRDELERQFGYLDYSDEIVQVLKMKTDELNASMNEHKGEGEEQDE